MLVDAEVATLRKVLTAILIFSTLTNALAQATTQSTVIRSGGSTFGAPLYNQWMSVYNGLQKWSGSAQIQYRTTGSSAGRNMLLNKTAMFAEGDSEWTTEELNSFSTQDVIKIPAVAGAVVLAYNIPEMADLPNVFLNLSRQIVADIYLGKVTRWNDPVLQTLNPAIKMPNQTINIVVRRDRGPTTYKFTAALSKFSDEFRTRIGPSSLPSWVIQNYNATGNGGVARAVFGFEYSIGYMGVASAAENNLPYATLINRAGNYVRAYYQNTESSFTNLSPSAVNILGNLTGDLDLHDSDGVNAYPIVGMTYYLLYRTVEQERCDLARQTARYLHWTYTSPAAVDIARQMSYIPMNGILLERVLAALKTVSCKTLDRNVTLWGQSVCDDGCKYGSCRFNFSFQPSSEVCQCQLGFKNKNQQNCSEEVVAIIMDSTNPLALFILIINSLLIIATIVVAALVIKHRKNHIIKAASPLFCILSLLGVLLAYLDVYFYVGQPTDAVCALRPVSVSFASAIFFGTMLPKTFRIYKVFRRIRALKSSINNRRLLLQSSLIIFINLLIIIIWYSIDVPRVLAIPGVDEKKFICASKNTTIDMVFGNIMLVYHGLLIAATTFLAIKVRVARDVFNEAVSIGVSVYGVTTVAIFFVPVSFIPSIDTQTFFLLRTLASIICATTVLGALFVPKIIAILRPTQLQSKPTEMGFSTAPSKKGSQKGSQNLSSAVSAPAIMQTEYYITDFFLKKNGLFSVWRPVKIAMISLKDSPGSGFLLFQDSLDPSIIFNTLRIQDTKLIFDDRLKSSGNSFGNSSAGNNDAGQTPNVTSTISTQNIARLMFADGYYDLEGKSPAAMATLIKSYAASPAASTKGQKHFELTSVANVRPPSTMPRPDVKGSFF
ncbi:hypothetical protein BKA69DRAFT_1121083 [Paraphysoderma sedebokerense]|nr:hypothetical protein BKA69DRAFT_1121083 [Paraphysoderma sedebokerense]